MSPKACATIELPANPPFASVGWPRPRRARPMALRLLYNSCMTAQVIVDAWKLASAADVVMRGLDPRINLLRKKLLRKWMDCRVKPGHDGVRQESNPKHDYFGGTNSGRPCAFCIWPAHSRSTAAMTFAGIGT